MRRFRQPLLARVSGTLALSFTAAVLAVGAWSSSSGWLGPLSVCGCLLTVALAVRHWQVGIDVSESEVRLINWARVISIPWAEVERFGYDQGLWVRRRDMRQHYSAAFRPTAEALPFTHAAGVRAAQDLEALRKKRRRQGGGKDRR